MLKLWDKFIPVLIVFIFTVGVISLVWRPLEAQGPFNPGLFTLRLASGSLTVGENTTPVTGMSGFKLCTVFLDVTTITTPDADDEVRFFIQTRYDGLNWTDIENVTFKTADDGTTAERIIIIDGANDGPGAIQSITGTDPAAGAEMSEAVPANTIWKTLSVRTTLVTDATVDTRVPHYQITDGTNVLWRAYSHAGQAASGTRAYHAAVGGIFVSAQDDGAFNNVLPITLLSAGGTVETTTTLFKAGDNWGIPQILIEAWHDPSRSTDGTIGDNLKS